MPSEAEVMAVEVAADFVEAAGVAGSAAVAVVAGHFVGAGAAVHSVVAEVDHFEVAVHSVEEDLTAASAEDSAADGSEGTDAVSGAATDSSSASVIHPGIGPVTATTDIPPIMGILTLMGILTHITDTTRMTMADSQRIHRMLVIKCLLPLTAE
jgi:hypothetical protein